jgi:hypothetical protein
MITTEAQRTLVKSPPELWAELSDPDTLAQHLAELGEIRIVGSEPETKVAWEGEGISGAVELRASGWGTKVTLSAVRQPPQAPPQPEPEPVVEPEPEPKVGFFARIFRRRKAQTTPEPEAVAEKQQEQPDPAAELRALEESMASETTATLTALLDKLGAAHHRPFSRA